LQAPYAGITRSGSVGRRTRAVVRTPPSQPTLWCELPKVFGPLMLTAQRGSLTGDQLLAESALTSHARTQSGRLMRARAAHEYPTKLRRVGASALDREPAARPGIKPAVEVDRLTTPGIEELSHPG
jgi:hypothetical protein